MSEAVQTHKKPASWTEILEHNKEAFAQALPSVGLTPERVIRTALTAMRQNIDLTKCEPKSVVASLLQACELGLSVSNTLGHCYLVPFNNTKKGIKECTMIIGYRGFTQLAMRSGKVNPIQTFIVYEKEPFTISGGSYPRIEHTPLPPAARGEKKIGVYAVAPLKDGSSAHAFLWADEVEAVRKRSRAGEFGPWVTDPDEMWKKTAIRRLAKMLPLSTDFQKAAVIDEYNEAGIVASDVIIAEEEQQTFEDSVKPAVEPVKDPEPEQKKEPATNGNGNKNIKDPEAPASEAQLKAIHALLGKLGIPDNTRHDYVSYIIDVNVNSMKDFNKGQASMIIDRLNATLRDKEADVNEAV